MKKNICTLLVLLCSGWSYASGGEHKAPELSDLFFPVINFGILFLFIFWKFRRPISDMFTKKAQEVEELYNHASDKSKKAEMKFDMYKKKMDDVRLDMDKIFASTDDEIRNLEEVKAKELRQSIDKLKQEMNQKFEMEKKAMYNSVERAFVDEVFTGVKANIGQDSLRKRTVTENLVSKIQ